MQYRTLGKARVLSDYVITGKVMPLAEVEIELPPDSEYDEYVLFVELFDNAVGEAIGEQYITYAVPDQNTEDALSVIIYNLLSAIPDVIELYGEDQNWSNKFIYLNPAFVWMPKVYTGTLQSLHIAGVAGEFMVDLHVLRFLAVKIGVEVSQDWGVVNKQPNRLEFIDMIVDFPVAVAYIIRPLPYMMLEPYIGGVLNLSLHRSMVPFIVSWTAGFQVGIKAGPGIITLDPRFSMDFGESNITELNYPYWRYTMHLGLGFKFGFIQK
jgi:hypothetical protein